MRYQSLAVCRLFLALAVLLATPLLLSGSVTADDLVQTYTARTGLQRGTIIQLDPKDSRVVEPVTDKTAAAMAGVVVAPNDTAVTLSDPATASRQVYVARTGHYELLVSDQNGAVKADDYLAVSALDGIAMKAGGDQSVVVGRALTGFDMATAASAVTKLRSSDGSSRTVRIRLVAADIAVSRNPLSKQASSRVPGLAFLQSGANAVAGKAVDPARLYISLVILLAASVIAAVLLYGAVRSSILSIGRNPLAKRSIAHGLTQTVAVGLVIFIIGLFGIYLVLKL